MQEGGIDSNSFGLFACLLLPVSLGMQKTGIKNQSAIRASTATTRSENAMTGLRSIS
jgi:hypothetical protein